MSRTKLYTILSIACVAGYIWLFYGFQNSAAAGNHTVEVCFIKQATDIPCPSCGSTRSVNSLLHGDLSSAWFYNPLGYFIALVMLITPVWLIYDISLKKQSLLSFYIQIEAYLNKPRIAIPLVALVIINWIWNIIKGL